MVILKTSIEPELDKKWGEQDEPKEHQSTQTVTISVQNFNQKILNNPLQQVNENNNNNVSNHCVTVGDCPETTNSEEDFQEKVVVKPTFKRYIILLLMALNLANKAFQWVQLPASTKKITYFYGVENFVINAASVVFMVPYIVLSIPTCCIIEQLGIRNSVLLASSGAALGAILKCFSCYYDGIYLLFISQTIVAVSEQMIYSVPSRLASVWFPDHQVSSAVAICVLGSQLGAAFGFLATEFTLQSAQTKEEIGQSLYWIFFVTAIVSLISLLLDFWLFDEAPKNPPGLARLKQLEEEEALKRLNVIEDDDGRGEGFMSRLNVMCQMMINLLNQKSFNLLWFSYGINVGISYTVPTILNQVLEPIWPGNDILIGNTGFIIILFGALALPLWGQLLDSAHRYLAINLFLAVATILSLILFGYAVSFTHSPGLVYTAAALYGAFQTGLVVGGLELAVELTYPQPELITSTLMNIMPQICGSIFVFIASYIVDNHGDIWTHAFYVSVISVALIMLMNIRETLRRQDAVLQKKKTTTTATTKDFSKG